MTIWFKIVRIYARSLPHTHMDTNA